MSKPEQNLQNHARVDPVFHYFLILIFLLNVLFCAVHFFYQRNWFSAWLLVLAVGLLFLLFRVRIYPLKVQDRVIRLEERLRISLLAPELRPRITELTEKQLVALRFASDDELPSLAAQALEERLSAHEIKKRIINWRPDHLRV